MIDTCGRLFDRESPSTALQSSLESRLRANLDVNGSLEYVLTWKHWDMSSGAPICALRASARRTSASDSTGEPSGWPTPDAAAMNVGADPIAHQERLQRLKAKHNNGNGAGLTLGIVAQMSGYATPTSRDHKDGCCDISALEKGENCLLSRQVLEAITTSSTSEMEKRGGLNPALSRWLIGFPPEWCDCAVTATPSSRKSRRRL